MNKTVDDYKGMTHRRLIKELIGANAYYAIQAKTRGKDESFCVPVRIHNVRWAYGRLHLLVTPHLGTGAKWIEFNQRLRIIDHGFGEPDKIDGLSDMEPCGGQPTSEVCRGDTTGDGEDAALVAKQGQAGTVPEHGGPASFAYLDSNTRTKTGPLHHLHRGARTGCISPNEGPVAGGPSPG